jgi:hypothetical protein
MPRTEARPSFVAHGLKRTGRSCRYARFNISRAAANFSSPRKRKATPRQLGATMERPFSGPMRQPGAFSPPAPRQLGAFPDSPTSQSGEKSGASNQFRPIAGSSAGFSQAPPVRVGTEPLNNQEHARNLPTFHHVVERPISPGNTEPRNSSTFTPQQRHFHRETAPLSPQAPRGPRLPRASYRRDPAVRLHG